MSWSPWSVHARHTAAYYWDAFLRTKQQHLMSVHIVYAFLFTLACNYRVYLEMFLPSQPLPICFQDLNHCWNHALFSAWELGKPRDDVPAASHNSSGQPSPLLNQSPDIGHPLERYDFNCLEPFVFAWELGKITYDSYAFSRIDGFRQLQLVASFLLGVRRVGQRRCLD